MGYQILTCDRCNQDFSGIDLYTPAGGKPVSVGFYRMYNKDDTPSIWHQFCHHTSEEIVCRNCMWDDPRFLERYPHMANPVIRKLIRDAGMK